MRAATYQARCDTVHEPPHDDWACLATAGRDGVDGRSMRVRGTYRAGEVYAALDVVALNGCSFIARRDDPGECPGDGWQFPMRCPARRATAACPVSAVLRVLRARTITKLADRLWALSGNAVDVRRERGPDSWNCERFLSNSRWRFLSKSSWRRDIEEPAPRPHAASPGVEHIVTSHSGYRAITLYAHADANALTVLCRPIKQIFECEKERT